jgi:seryl-tRNA synthetase
MSADYVLPPPRRPRPALSGGDGGGTLDPMEARVARLEDDMREVKTDLKALRDEIRAGFKEVADQFKDSRSDMANLRAEVAEIKGRVSQLPTVWQVNMQMIGLMFTVLGGAFVIMRYAAH